MSLLIKEVQVIDGEGTAPYKADVFIDRNAISAIGNLKGKEAGEVIEGFGDYLTPGFIEPNATSDHYLTLFTNPRQEDFVSQGVTTIIGGHCGSSLAPLLYGSLESIRKWADPHSVNVNWHSLGEFLNSLERLSLGVNFGTLVGHSTVRRDILGHDERPLTLKELWVFKRILNRSLEEGAFGLSTGLEFLHGRSATEKEIKELAALLKKTARVYTTHLRNETGELVKSVEEAGEIASRTRVSTVISHFRPIHGFENEFGKALKLIQDSSNLYFDVYPYDTSIMPAYTLLPEYIPEKNLEETFRKLQDKEIVKKTVKGLQNLNPEDIVIASAEKAEYLVGKTLADLIEGTNLTPAEGLLKLLNFSKMRATVFYRNIDLPLLMETLKDERALISSNGNSLPKTNKYLKHERSTGTFPKFLELAAKSGSPIEKAVRKITSTPAEIFGLKRRGAIKVGNVADLVLLTKSGYEIKETILGGKRMKSNPKGEILKQN